MELLHQALRFLHIATGFFGLVLFWIPAFAHKGSNLHRRAGRLFELCAYVVLATAVLALSTQLSLVYSGSGPVEPKNLIFAALLFYLSLLTFASVRHGVRVIATRQQPETIKTPFHQGLAIAVIIASLLLSAIGLRYDALLLLAFGPLGILSGLSILRYIGSANSRHMGWFYEHLGAMIGSGIAFHTAFAVFGARRLFGLPEEGFIAIIPWLLPAVVGTLANTLLERSYRRRFAKAEQAFARRSIDDEPKPALETQLG